MSETILVTGACGFTGSNMLEYLDEEYPDATVVATDLPGSLHDEYYVESPGNDDPEPTYYAEILEELDVEFIAADLTEPDQVEAIGEFEYDRVFHIASLYDYFATRETLYAINVDGTRNLLSVLATQETAPRLVHWSTLGVLGDAGFDRPKVEDDGYHPENRYCESKVSQEQIVKAFEDRIDTTIIRPAPIYGPRHKYGVYNIIWRIKRMGVAPVIRNYPRSYQRQFPCVHIDDILGATDHLSTLPEAEGETYNVLSDCIPIDEMISFVADEMGARKITLPMPEPLFKLQAAVTYQIALRVEKRARKKGYRPPIEAPTVRYLTGNMWFSNEKLKESGYELTYQDPRDGLTQYIQWCRDAGYLEDETAAAESPKSERSLLQRVTGR